MTVLSPPQIDLASKSNDRASQLKDVKETRFRAIRAMVLFAVLLVPTLLLVEIILACAGFGEEEMVVFDPHIAFRHMTDKHVTWRREGYSTFKLNEQGMREPEATVLKPPHTYRIAILGDSMVEGVQVPLEKTFGRIVERQLNEQEAVGKGQKIQVLNFGVFGYSTVQEYLLLKEHVLKYKPDLVLLCYHTHDMFENIESWTPPNVKPCRGRPYAIQLPGKPFVVDCAPVLRQRQSNAFDWFKRNSRISGALNVPREFKLSNNLLSMHVGGPKLAKEAISQSAGQKIMVAVLAPTMSSLLKAAQDECLRANAKFAVITVPSRYALLPEPGMPKAPYNLNYEQEIRIVNQACLDHQIPIQDCHQIATTLPPSQQKQLFYSLHYAPEGHAFLASVLNPFLRKQI